VNDGHARLVVDLGPRSYDILVGDGLLARAGAHMAPVLQQKRALVVTDRVVAGLHLEALQRSLSDAGIAHGAIILDPGEGTKDFVHLQWLLDRMLELKIERSTTVVALGGGVVGDLAGLAASIVLRGVDFVQIPTTLLAQVDSSVGGKTGVNTAAGKNLVGTFHQPRLVLADTGVLGTLPRRALRAGYAEVVKYGLIDDPEFFGWLERHGEGVIAGDAAARRQAVLKSCAAKASIVAADEREAGQRALLNLGHTFAHALEAEAGYSDGLLHGEAVAIGLGLAFRLSARLGLCAFTEATRVERHLASVGLPGGPPELRDARWTAERLLAHMAQDKKVKDGKLVFVLARGIGRAFLARDVDPADVRAVLELALAA